MWKQTAGRLGRYLLGPTPIWGAIEAARHREELQQWLRRQNGGSCPHLIKQATVRSYAAAHKTRCFVETGTYLGEMTYAMRNDFDRLVSIELDDRLYRGALRRFARFPHVTVEHGDSASVLPRILPGIDRPTLFWLDGHYSGGFTARGQNDTPIVDELRSILVHQVDGHVILVDDAREFTGKNGYPTVEELGTIVKQSRPTWKVEVACDIIRISSHEGRMSA
jgi:hypothetical protein